MSSNQSNSQQPEWMDTVVENARHLTFFAWGMAAFVSLAKMASMQGAGAGMILVLLAFGFVISYWGYLIVEYFRFEEIEEEGDATLAKKYPIAYHGHVLAYLIFAGAMIIALSIMVAQEPRVVDGHNAPQTAESGK